MKQHLNKLPEQIRELIALAAKTAEKTNARAYLVGGFVRDLLLGVENLDLDIVVEGDGIRFAESLSAALGSRLVRHHAFGTATIVSSDHLKLDIASARKEVYPKPAHLPRVSPGAIEDDLFRRDFTINAMAVDISPGCSRKLCDLFGGLADLRAKKVRVMHEMSFIDDPTRILRAVRFEKRYGFAIDPKTLGYLKSAVQNGLMGQVTSQRLRAELALLLKEKDPVKALRRVQALCGFGFIHKKLRLTKKTLKLLSGVKKETAWFSRKFPHRRKLDAWLMYLMALVDPLSASDIRVFCARFSFARGEEKRMSAFKSLGPSFIRKLFHRSSSPWDIFSMLEPLPYEVILLVKAKYKSRALQTHIEEFLKIYHGTRIRVSGADLQKLGCKPGPQYQQIFKSILRARLEGRLISHEDELALACKIARVQKQK